MTSILPFKIDKSVQETSHVVEDGLGHSVEMPKYGCLTVEEAQIYHRYTLDVIRQDNEPFFCYKVELVHRLICSRYGVPLETPKDEIFVYPDGSPVGEPMIDALYEFFEWERLRWDTNAKEVENKDRGKLIGTQSTTN